ncbi:MAG: hypothetical protein U0892_05460 [Pirellulales bacterium]
MWRAFFMAVGTMVVILGLECLIIDSATLATDSPPPMTAEQSWFGPQAMYDPNRIVKPAEWIPWSLLACGAIVLLYAITLPKRWGNN